MKQNFLGMILLLLAFPLATTMSCHHSPNPDQHKAKQIQTRLNKMNEDMKILDQKIKLSDNDQGMKDLLNEERELLRSRIERMIELSKSLGTKTAQEKSHGGN